MSGLKTLFKQTFIYGLATVLPRMLSFLLTPLYTSPEVLSVEEYGRVSFIFSYFVLFNVILAYGMETAFFRFFNKAKDPKKVTSTSSTTLIISSVCFFIIALLLKHQIANLTDIKVEYIQMVIWILLLDALAIIPFAWLRTTQRPIYYAVIKILNVALNLGLNVFFLIHLTRLSYHNSLAASICVDNFEINYIFIANVVSSGFTLLLLLPFYLKIKYVIHWGLLKKMFHYAFPVLISGIAYSINETFDRILLKWLLPENIAETQIGMYSACYKIAMFMTLFVTAYKLGVEPYFFSHSNNRNPQKNYAKILEFFIAFGCIILLGVTVFADIIKILVVRSDAFWEAMWIIPILLLANLCLGIYHNLSVWYKITDQTKFGAIISVMGAIITLAFNFWLIPIIGYKGSAIATLCAYASMMGASYMLGNKYYPIPYNLKKMSLYIIVSTLFSVISFYFFRENYGIGISLLILFLLIVYRFEKHEIKRIIQHK